MSTEPGGYTLEALIDELARVLHDPGEARELARRAGFPVADLPAFDTARVFWSRVVRAADDGKTVGGVGAIVAQARARFPGNRFFAAYGSTTAATTAESMPPEPRLGAAIDNRSASIGQQIVVHGNATFGAMTGSVPAPGGPSSGPATAPPTPDFPEYRMLARAQHQHLRLVGFDERVKVAIELRDLYVELDVVLDHGTLERMLYSDAHQAKAHAEQYARCERIVMAEAFARAKGYGKRGLVLLGDPGSGKTTQLRRVLLQVLSTPEDGGGPEVLGLPVDTLPVFLPLRSLAGHAWPRTLVELLARVLSGPAGRSMTELAQALVDRGNLLLLFDGLDEVADEAQRDEVARWLEALLFDRPDCWFLVSSRYAGYTPTVKLEADFLELHLRPLTDEQAQRFVENWYRVVEVAEAERDGRAPGPGRAAELLVELQGLERRGEAQIYAMIRNPLLLTAICLVHRRAEGALPAGREALYRECTRVLLEGWRKRGKQLPVVLPAEQATRVLQPVALWMHGEDGRTQASAAELAGPVATGFQSIGRPGVDASELLRRIRDESGLLTGWGLDRYGFMHLGFQEYLAALELRRRGAEGRGSEAVDGLRALAGRFGETWWREVILLMLAHGDVGLLEQLLGHVAARPELETWTQSAVMSRVLGQYDREALAGLDGVMLGHASLGVRTWWRRVRGLEARAGLETKVVHGVELVLVPGGRFVMGSPEGEEGRFEDEGPQHEVEVASFWLARTPVTNAQYGAYMNANPGVQKPEYWAAQEYDQPQQPVVGVSWDEAKAYCAWAGLQLPTEAQWEYACRAGTTTRYCSGDAEEDLKKVGWYKGNSGGRLHAVRELEPNGWGLYDMHGNVYEWCEDTWVDNYEGPEHQPGDGLRVKPVGAASRVVRGCRFDNEARYARSACRGLWHPAARYHNVGLRPAQGHP